MGAVAHIEDYKAGRYFQKETRGDMSWNGYETNVLLRNLGNNAQGIPEFTDVSTALGADDIVDSRGVALLDYDLDGDLDIAISHNPGDLHPQGVAPALYRNDTGKKNNWLIVDLVGKTVNRDAIGSRVLLETKAGRQVRLKTAGSGYASQQTSSLYFGLGNQQTIQKLRVIWPDGSESQFQNLESNQRLDITQGQELKKKPLITVPSLKASPKNPSGE